MNLERKTNIESGKNFPPPLTYQFPPLLNKLGKFLYLRVRMIVINSLVTCNFR